MSLIPRYRKYSDGGSTKKTELATGIGQGAAVLGSLADSFSQPNQYGKRSLTGNLASNVGKFAGMGASVGGPVGAGVGAAVGLVKGFIDNGAQKKQMRSMQSQERFNQTQEEWGQAQSRLAADPNLLTGNLAGGYYAAGGQLNVANQEVEGGTATPLSSTAAEFKGPSHEEGGIQLPGAEAEVEGKETTNGDYVFSHRLGFAQLHRPIAKAIGKIEKKAMTPERVASINLLKEKENGLRLSQEYAKETLGLN